MNNLLGGIAHRGHLNDVHSKQTRSQARHSTENPTVALTSSIPFPCRSLSDPRVPKWSSEDQQLSVSAGRALPVESSS